jgi:hemolysin activation/secretion protein
MLHAAFEAIDETQTAPAFDANLYKDAIRVLRVGADWTHAFSTTTLASAGFNLSQGFSGLGSRGRDDAATGDPVSTDNARDDFSKLEGQLRISQNLPAGLSAELTARGQNSFAEPLFKSEQFSIGGPHLLSAYDAGNIFGDSGWMLRGELRYDRTLQTAWAGGVVEPYLFGAHGQVFITDPTALETSSVAASSFGLGARFSAAPNLAAPREIEIGIEGARQLSNDIGEKDGWRFNLYLASRY